MGRVKVVFEDALNAYERTVEGGMDAMRYARSPPLKWELGASNRVYHRDRRRFSVEVRAVETEESGGASPPRRELEEDAAAFVPELDTSSLEFVNSAHL